MQHLDKQNLNPRRDSALSGGTTLDWTAAILTKRAANQLLCDSLIRCTQSDEANSGQLRNQMPNKKADREVYPLGTGVTTSETVAKNKRSKINEPAARYLKRNKK